MLEVIIAIVPGLVLMAATSAWATSITYSCPHSYERIDTCNDKDIILVCRRCGKIKKLRK